uniref:Uncharacterized protein n=1 Tax=Yersinia ruckeri TaxID=29486 RepID=A0A0A8VCH9_YERRU|nr:hypothetical protein CSF007_8620 [Yersinia ruckeri]
MVTFAVHLATLLFVSLIKNLAIKINGKIKIAATLITLTLEINNEVVLTIILHELKKPLKKPIERKNI